MKKTILASLLASSLVMAEQGNITVEPYVEPEKVEEVTPIPVSVALLGGMMKFAADSHDGHEYDAEFIFGAELSFPCFLSSDFRSQLQVLMYDDGFTETWQISANPHYIFKVSEDTQIGVGPSLGIAHFEIDAKNDYIFTFGVGASVRHDIDEKFFVGAEARYEWPAKAEIDGMEYDTNNFKIFAKIGMNF